MNTIYNQHILDYIEYHTEQTTWYDELEQRQQQEQIYITEHIESLNGNYHE